MNATKAAPAGVRNHNPSNIMDYAIPWEGLVGHDANNRCIFSTDLAGARAQAVDVLGKWMKGAKTVRAIVSIFAPEHGDHGDNNPVDAYSKFIADRLGKKPNDPIDLSDRTILGRFCDYQAQFENGGVYWEPALFYQAAGMAIAKRKPAKAASVATGSAASLAIVQAVEPIVKQTTDALQPLADALAIAKYALGALALVSGGLALWKVYATYKAKQALAE